MENIKNDYLIKNYNAIDCMKLVMAIVVVAIHTEPFSSFNFHFLDVLFDQIVSYAVPFFFIASGFFLYNKKTDIPLYDRLKHIRIWWKKILRLYLIWTAIFLPYTFYGFYIDNIPPLKSFFLFIRNVLLVGQNYWSWPLWYLLAMLVAGALIYLMEKLKFTYIQMLIVGVLLTSLGYYLNYLDSLNLENEGWYTPVVSFYFRYFLHTRNGFFQGLIYMLLGIGVAKYRPSISFRHSIILLIITSVWGLLGGFLARYFYCFFLFLCTYVYKMHGNNHIYKKIRLISTIIYFLHMIVVGGFILCFGDNCNSMLFFLIVLSIVFMITFLLLKRQDRTWFKLCFN